MPTGKNCRPSGEKTAALLKFRAAQNTHAKSMVWPQLHCTWMPVTTSPFRCNVTVGLPQLPCPAAAAAAADAGADAVLLGIPLK
jgi:hypothetical protein